ELALARAELHLDRAQRQAQRDDAAAQRLEYRLHLIEARLGEILVALRDQAHLGGLRRPCRIGGGEPWIVDAEKMQLDLEPSEEIEAGLAELVQRFRIEPPRRKRHRLAVAEIDVAKEPTGLLRPGQHAEARRIRHH